MLRDNKDAVLINTESGEYLLRNLKERVAAPTDVKFWLLTPAHMEHIGSSFNKFVAQVFPNAVDYMNRIEHEFWSLSASKISRRFLNLRAEMVALML